MKPIMSIALTVHLLLLAACSNEADSANPAQGTAVDIESMEEKHTVIQGYIVRKDGDTMRVMESISKEEIVGKNKKGLEAHLRKHYDGEGYNVDLSQLDEETKSTLHIGQKVTVAMDWIYFTLPASGSALEVRIQEQQDE